MAGLDTAGLDTAGLVSVSLGRVGLGDDCMAAHSVEAGSPEIK